MKCPQQRIENTLLEIIRFRDKEVDLIIDSYAIAGKLNVEQRKVRQAFSNLRKKLITFIPIKKKKGCYILFNESNPKHQELLKNYVETSIKHVKTMYFNDIVKYVPILKDEKLKTEIGQMYFALKGE